jgi:hypothetical protein
MTLLCCLRCTNAHKPTLVLVGGDPHLWLYACDEGASKHFNKPADI